MRRFRDLDRPRSGWRAVAVAGCLLASWLAATCAGDRPVPGPPNPAGIAGEGGLADAPTVVRFGSRTWPAIVVKTHGAREEFALRKGDGASGAAGDPAGWLSPVDRVWSAPSPTVVLFAWATAVHRPLALRDARLRPVVVVFLDGTARVRAVHPVRLGAERRPLDPGGPVRFVLFLRPEAIAAGEPLEGRTAVLPPAAWHGAEPEYVPIESPPPAVVRVGAATVRVEVADTPAKRLRGLMYRDRVPEGTGMLFLYSEDDVQSFWMLNTRVPLDLAYADRYGVIRRLVRLEPHALRGKSSEIPVRVALECPAGWFERHGVRVGDRLEFPPDLRGWLDANAGGER
ncbi:MAG: DUF192 domain-containing protein [Planctomycetes bacterium]|nr:DUF192 domain-containing protein [Planctomycetota bacterium]